MHLLRRTGWTTLVVIGLAMSMGALCARAERRFLPKPVRVSLSVEGEPAPVTGAIVAWDESSLFVEGDDEGDERAVAWRAVKPAQAYDIARRLIDAKDEAGWVWLGLTMLGSGDEALAKRAFDVAVRLDAGLKERVREAFALYKDGADPAGAFGDAEPEAEDGAEGSEDETEERPERVRRGVDPLATGPGGAKPWPTLSDEQFNEHTRLVRLRCDELLRSAGMTIEPLETEMFVFYSELSRPETERWTRELDRMYQSLLEALEIPKGARLFQGKAPILIFKSRERFLDFESKAFRYDASLAGGLNHQIGGYTFTVFYRMSNDREFNTILIHETVHAFMYRYRSPAALPTWANEGLADYVAGHLVAGSTEPSSAWSHARNFVAKQGDPLSVMGQDYRDGSWPDEDSYPVSHMLVRFMLKHKPRAFKEWIDDIKAGKDWEQSLSDRFRVTPELLAKGFADDIFAEPGYQPLR